MLAAVRAATLSGEMIRLPAIDKKSSRPESIVFVDNPFGGSLGPYRYQLEGEEDLLHMIVTREDGGTISVEEGQAVAAVVWDGVPSALVWLRPGERTQHFYIGHDDLLEDTDRYSQ